MGKKKRLDLFELNRDEYAAHEAPRLVRSLPAQYLTISGKGEPDGPAFLRKVKALYTMAITIRGMKKDTEEDYAICRIEGLWWGKDKQELDFLSEPKSEWNWKLLTRTPSFVAEEDRVEAMMQLVERGKDSVISQVHLQSLSEGLCIQMLHVGPFESLGETLGQMRAFAEKENLFIYGAHHEVYLSDAKRVAPEELKTIVRLPVH